MFYFCLLGTSAAIIVICLYKLHQKFHSYFSKVVEKSRQKLASRETSALVTQLNRYSQKIQSWYEQCESESEDEEIIETYTNHRSLGTQTTDTELYNNKTLKAEDVISPINNNSWRWNRSSVPINNPLPVIDSQAIRAIQKEQLQMLLRQVRYFGEKDLKAPLVICVETNFTNISGFLINFKQKLCKFYVYGINHLPWRLEKTAENRDMTECKMKNVLFALLLWEQEILAMKKFSFFCTFSSINQPDCPFGAVATDFLEHFTSCENVIRVNSNCQVSKYKDTAQFAKLIQPVRDLLSWNLSRFNQYIKKAYGILDFEGTHSLLDDYQENAKDDGYYAKTYRFHHFQQKVNKNAEKWCKGCQKCGLQYKPLKFSKEPETTLTSEEGSSDESNSETLPFPLSKNRW